jgi:hypothetical protein
MMFMRGGVRGASSCSKNWCLNQPPEVHAGSPPPPIPSFSKAGSLSRRLDGTASLALPAGGRPGLCPAGGSAGGRPGLRPAHPPSSLSVDTAVSKPRLPRPSPSVDAGLASWQRTGHCSRRDLHGCRHGSSTPPPPSQASSTSGHPAPAGVPPPKPTCAALSSCSLYARASAPALRRCRLPCFRSERWYKCWLGVCVKIARCRLRAEFQIL